MQENTKENKIANNKVDDLYNIWLGRRDIFQLFENDEPNLQQDIQDIRELLDEN